MSLPEWLEDRTILKVHTGSMVYGTALEDSDTDIYGIAVPPPDVLIGLRRWDQIERLEPIDLRIDSLHKWARLAIKGNPNVLEPLWTPDNYFLMLTKHGRMLIEERDIFLSKYIKGKYFGYAKQQLQRMTRIDIAKSSNPKRAELFDLYGYDTKNAMHLVRLLRTIFEILTEGTIHVQRYDSKELVDIRTGQWTIEGIQAEERRLTHLVDKAMVTTSLPDKCDFDRVNELVMDITRSMLN